MYEQNQNEPLIFHPVSPPNTAKRDSTDRLTEIATEIIYKKERIIQNFVEIGRLLNEAKDYTEKEHEKWLPWLKAVGIHPRTAQIYMEVARAFPNANTISHLGVAKAHALLALPEDEREPFLQETHQVRGISKNVSEMSVRAVKEAIKYRKTPTSDTPQEDAFETEVEENNETFPEGNDKSNDSITDEIESARAALECVLRYLSEEENDRSLLGRYSEAFHTVRTLVDKCISFVEGEKLKQ